MIASMTGFGRSEVKESGTTLTIELRSLNHRFLDVEVRSPKELQAFDGRIKELLVSQFSRGRVSVAISVSGAELVALSPSIDKALANSYLKVLQELKSDLKLDGAIGLEQLLSLPDVVTFDCNGEIKETYWEQVEAGMRRAMADLKKMRLREGVEIKKDLVARISAINSVIAKVEKNAGERSNEIFDKLRSRVEQLTQNQNLDDGRLEMEVALLAEKADVTEECIRFKSHTTLFLELLENENPEGRKLNFLLQEMHREANTIGSKANDAQVAHWVVAFKDEIEKLREQVQNIE